MKGLFALSFYFVVDLEDSSGIPDSNPSSVQYVVNILPFSLFLGSWDERLNSRGQICLSLYY